MILKMQMMTITISAATKTTLVTMIAITVLFKLKLTLPDGSNNMKTKATTIASSRNNTKLSNLSASYA